MTKENIMQEIKEFLENEYRDGDVQVKERDFMDYSGYKKLGLTFVCDLDSICLITFNMCNKNQINRVTYRRYGIDRFDNKINSYSNKDGIGEFEAFFGRYIGEVLEVEDI